MSIVRTVIALGIGLWWAWTGGPAAGGVIRLPAAVVLVGATEVPASEHAAGAGAGPADINPLSFDKLKADLALWTALVFLVLLAILWKYAWGPLADGLEKRERRIAAEIEAAQKANQEAQAQLAQYQQKLAEAGQEVQRMLDDARRQAEEVGAQIVAKSRQEAEAEHQRALAEIDAATAAALEELARRSADLAVQLAGRIVRTRLDRADHARLIEEAVDQFTRPRSNGN
ncbi:MAG TPA: ATP synthase F0 subunit B [Planctomycetes bacterium]|nr:ATP synthase F0 subunit B [Planctomycetota bacterium]